MTELTKIDRYYFDQLKRGTDLVRRLNENQGSLDILREAKYWGLSDDQIAQSWAISPQKVADLREENQLHRVYKEVDPSAGNLMSTPTAFTPPLKPKTRATPPPAPGP